MDFVKDQNPKPIYLADQLIGLPDFIKAAATITPESLEDLNAAAFGDPSKREFPVHTKEATWLSACYAMGSGTWHTDVHLENAIRKSAALFEITEEVNKLEDAFAQHFKSATVDAPARQYALTMDFKGEGGLGVQPFYPIDDADAIVKSAKCMVNDYAEGRLRIEFFRIAALEMVKAAKALDMDRADIHPMARGMGSDRLPDFDHALDVINMRKSAGVPDAGLELYKAAVEGARAEPESIDRWLDLWLDMDATYGVKYAALQPDPYTAFYAGTPMDELEKAAKEMAIIEGAALPMSAVRLVPESAIRQHFRKEASEKLLAAQGCSHAGDMTAAFDGIDSPVRKEFLELVLKAAA